MAESAEVEAQGPKQVAEGCGHKQQRKIGRFECDVTGCHKVYNRKDNLALHMQRSHCTRPEKAGRFKCNVTGCNETFYHRVKLITHLKTEHGVDVGKKLHEYYKTKLISFLHGMYTVTERKEFNSWSDFESWKEEEEAHSHCCFVRPAGKKVEIAKDGKCMVKIAHIIITY